jgi:hypothetical protein
MPRPEDEFRSLMLFGGTVQEATLGEPSKVAPPQ